MARAWTSAASRVAAAPSARGSPGRASRRPRERAQALVGAFPRHGEAGIVNPIALDTLHLSGYPTQGLRSKSWGEFARPGAPAIDFVITVCDAAAAEACPVFPGKPVAAHWGVPDPAAVKDGPEARRRAFAATLDVLRRRVQHLTGLPFDSVDARALGHALREIGTL